MLVFWCFSGGVLCWCFCGGVVVLVFLWWCLCGGVCVVVFLWWCFCGGVCVVVILWWCLRGGVFVVVFVWWCLCGGVWIKPTHCSSHQSKGSINQGCHKPFYRHMFCWFIYTLPFWNFRHRLVRYYWYSQWYKIQNFSGLVYLPQKRALSRRWRALFAFLGWQNLCWGEPLVEMSFKSAPFGKVYSDCSQRRLRRRKRSGNWVKRSSW